jgi:DNA replicative helicase MCM subunit Mcm2 (Cdc46/Mcm family)
VGIHSLTLIVRLSSVLFYSVLVAMVSYRFDLVIVLRDTANKEWDKQVSTFLLKQAVRSPTPARTVASSSSSNTTTGDGGGYGGGYGSGGGESNPWSLSLTATAPTAPAPPPPHATTAAAPATSYWGIRTLRQYIAFVKYCIHPTVGPEARTVLVRIHTVFILVLCFLLCSAQTCFWLDADSVG